MRIENALERQLIVADEQLASLEDVARVMPDAQYLNVAFNDITSLSGLKQLRELRCLDISHNSVESLQELVALSNLLVLKCSSNQIADLSWIAGLTHLDELWVRDNRVESAQFAHLVQLTALQTLVIHPNPCTERDDYVLPVLKVLPWLRRVDTVVVTEELREEARHAEERGALDSGATDCSLFSLSGRAEEPTPNEASEVSVDTTPPIPTKPPKSKKQITAEEIMRAFPVQDFIPVDGNVEPVETHLSDFEDEGVQMQKPYYTAAANAETADNQNEISTPSNMPY
ncbi:L domain-like protein [Phytophthora cinnamomi]|uniref:L domain-like protein n=1 Tax=Phytophthora cinnamomi TaxID=4785 RepID=UPI0035598A4E|nr:L domain-like protein [Phytophthora cinnamomi]